MVNEQVGIHVSNKPLAIRYNEINDRYSIFLFFISFIIELSNIKSNHFQLVFNVFFNISAVNILLNMTFTRMIF